VFRGSPVFSTGVDLRRQSMTFWSRHPAMHESDYASVEDPGQASEHEAEIFIKMARVFGDFISRRY